MAQTRDEWLAQRRKGIGASDVSKVVGLSPWGGPLDVYMDKRGLTAPTETTDIMRVGQVLEPAILQLYAERTGQEVASAADVWPNLPIAHPERPWQLATPDGLTAAGVPVEAKNTSRKDGWGEPGTDEMPMVYLVQVNWQLSTLKLPRGDVAALFYGRDLGIYSVELDGDLEEMLVERVRAFWFEHVLPGVPPAPTAADADAIRRLYPRVERDELIQAPELAGAVERLDLIKRQLKTLEAEKAEHEATIKARIGDAAGVEGGWGKATWKAPRASEVFDHRAAVKANAIPAETISEYTIERQMQRRFNIYIKGGE